MTTSKRVQELRGALMAEKKRQKGKRATVTLVLEASVYKPHVDQLYDELENFMLATGRISKWAGFSVLIGEERPE